MVAHSRSYSFHHWIRPYDGAVSLDNAARLWWGELNTALHAAGWTTIGSHSGSGAVYNDGTSNPLVAGTDSWPIANVTGRAWHVWQCPPAMGRFQLCVHQYYNQTSNAEYIGIWFSPGGQFLVSGGGTDGTTTVRPTAPDEMVRYAGNGTPPWTSDSPYTVQLHAAWADDGTQLFIYAKQNAGNNIFAAFSVMDNPDPAVLDGLAAVWKQGASSVTTQADTQMGTADHYTSANWVVSIGGVGYGCYLGGRGFANLGLSSLERVQGDKKMKPSPCEVYPSSIPQRGFVGTIPDLYWVPAGFYGRGMGASVGGPILWLAGDAVAMPWDAAEPLPLDR